MLAPRAHAARCFVRAAAGGNDDGSSWTDAYTDLQTALADADCTEIWVAKGVYRPGSTRPDTFQLRDGVAIYGGFHGDESVLSDRDVAANPTVLSGDLAGDDGNTNADGVVTDPAGINGTNSKHVVTASGTDATAVLDGVTITAGNGGTGGGMYNEDGAPTLSHVTFEGNTAGSGGAMFNWGYDSIPDLSFDHLTFVNNQAVIYGGAIYDIAVNITLTLCSFENNEASSDGGAIYHLDGGGLTVEGSTFSKNQAYFDGGAIKVTGGGFITIDATTFAKNSSTHRDAGAVYLDSVGTFTNVTFSENVASAQGGALAINCSANPFLEKPSTLRNLTFRFNRADRGGALQVDSCIVKVYNSILWVDSASLGYPEVYPGGEVTFYNSIVEQSGGSGPGWNSSDGTDGGGNLDEHPWYDDLGDRGGPTETIAIRPTSAALDSADDSECPPTDQRGVSRPQDGTGDGVAHCDMGAFEVVLPTPTITTPFGATTNASPFTVNIHFDLPVEGFGLSGVVVGNGTASNFSGSGDSYSVEITPTTEGTVTIDVPAGAATWPPGGWFETGTEPSQGFDNVAAKQLKVLYDTTAPTVLSTSLKPLYVGPGPSQFTVVFSKAMFNPVGDDNVNDVTNPANYLLVGAGHDGSFETTSCASGVATDDVAVAASSVSWDGATNTATVALGVPLAGGYYRLFICGTTSLEDLAGNLLNGGTDDTVDFQVAFAVPTLGPVGLALLALLIALAACRVIPRD